MRILFLDIDGVLNHNTFYEDRQAKIKSGDWDIEYPKSELDPDCVRMIIEFCKDYDVKVVISSTWRNGRSIEKFNELFAEYGEGMEVIDRTPSYHTKGWVRGNEILWWMEDNEKLIGCRYHQYHDYVILDDDSDMLYWQRDNFILVDRFVGITPQTIFKMKQMLRIHDDPIIRV
jgi:hypothetical protein